MSSRGVKYLIVENDHGFGLAECVNSLIEDGYRPFGGICVVKHAGGMRYVQAMIYAPVSTESASSE